VANSEWAVLKKAHHDRITEKATRTMKIRWALYRVSGRKGGDGEHIKATDSEFII
jgi:hypothetical protein